ncbi:MAG: guanylate kinase, partial [Clostridia bacterium]|nr:guanylate kinase [Clostridia bacterium]
GEFLEYNEYMGNYYGTPRTPIEESVSSGRDIVLEIDINGAHKVKEQMPEAVGIFIAPPSFAVLKGRLLGRSSESEEQVAGRMRQAVEEMKHAEEYDYVVVNDQGKVEECAQRISDIILGNYENKADSEKIKTNLIKEVIKDVESVNW